MRTNNTLGFPAVEEAPTSSTLGAVPRVLEARSFQGKNTMKAVQWVVATLFLGALFAAHAQTPTGTMPEGPVELTAPVQTPPPAQGDSGASQDAPPTPALTSTPPRADAAPGVAAPGASPAPEVVSASTPAWWEISTWWLVIPAWLLALVVLGLAIYTARLSKATSALLRHVKDTTRKELRSYVALDDIFFYEAAEGAAGVQKLRIRNFGQTPAARMSIWCERASHLPQEGVKPFYDAPAVDSQLLHPVQAYTLALSAAPLYRLGKPGFFTYGRIVYQDIYERWWVTRFCHRYEGDGNFVPYGDYNSEEGPFETAPA